MKKVRLLISVLLAVVFSNLNAQNFKQVKIGNQIWMTENLNAYKFRNGDTIPEAKTVEEWKKASANNSPAWCYYANNPASGASYGKLYNWFAVNDPRGLAPEGWHIPGNAEWTSLTEYLGGADIAGGKLKEAGITHWKSPNTEATNKTGFSALPGGDRGSGGLFNLVGSSGFWWSATEEDADSAGCIDMFYRHSKLTMGSSLKQNGFSVRCLRD